MFNYARTSSGARKNLIPTDTFLFKCIQIFEVSVLRHGFMTVGPTGGAKTTAMHMLNQAMSDLDGVNEKYSHVRRWILNPKAITMGQLYGEFDENTHEWTDGILCVLYRAAAKAGHPVGHYHVARLTLNQTPGPASKQTLRRLEHASRRIPGTQEVRRSLRLQPRATRPAETRWPQRRASASPCPSSPSPRSSSCCSPCRGPRQFPPSRECSPIQTPPPS